MNRYLSRQIRTPIFDRFRPSIERVVRKRYFSCTFQMFGTREIGDPEMISHATTDGHCRTRRFPRSGQSRGTNRVSYNVSEPVNEFCSRSGLTFIITWKTNKFKSIKVESSHSMFSYKGSDDDAPNRPDEEIKNNNVKLYFYQERVDSVFHRFRFGIRFQWGIERIGVFVIGIDTGIRVNPNWFMFPNFRLNIFYSTGSVRRFSYV